MCSCTVTSLNDNVELLNQLKNLLSSIRGYKKIRAMRGFFYIYFLFDFRFLVYVFFLYCSEPLKVLKHQLWRFWYMCFLHSSKPACINVCAGRKFWYMCFFTAPNLFSIKEFNKHSFGICITYTVPNLLFHVRIVCSFWYMVYAVFVQIRTIKYEITVSLFLVYAVFV